MKTGEGEGYGGHITADVILDGVFKAVGAALGIELGKDDKEISVYSFNT